MQDIVLSRQQIRAADRIAIEKYGIPGIVLMENAGRGMVDVMCQFGVDGPVVVCCGKGNNAGDGFVIARHLELRGHPVKVVLCCEPTELKGDAKTNYHPLVLAGIPVRAVRGPDDLEALDRLLTDADWIVDALLGTGATGAPRPPLDEVLRRLNGSSAKRMAVDIPSGLDCDSGQAATETFRADHTCTFLAAKPGLVSPHASAYVGRLHVLDIGTPQCLMRDVLETPG